MDLYFATEARFQKDAQGRYASKDSVFANEHWKRYFECFDKIIIIARVENLETELKTANLICDEKISFLEIPCYNGLSGYLRSCNCIRKIIQENIDPHQAYILRVPGIIGQSVGKILRKKKIPYSVEVVGDPWDVWGPGVIKHPLRKLIRVFSTWQLKKQVNRAENALYVTKTYLQKRYKTSSKAFVTNASNIDLPQCNIAKSPKLLTNRLEKPTRLLAVGSLAQMYKSPDMMIDAVVKLNAEGIKCSLTWVGDGNYRKKMCAYAERSGAGSYIQFPGSASNKEVLELMNQTDIFVSSSKTEGLPRVIIEAMSVGLPCIATDVGGTSELLDVSALVRKADSTLLSEKIKEFVLNPDIANHNAALNLKKAYEYSYPVLSKKRNEFYRKVSDSVKR